MINICEYDNTVLDEIRANSRVSPEIEQTVSRIIDDVCINKDEALKKYSIMFDKVDVSKGLEVTPAEMDEAWEKVPGEFVEILKEAAANIREFHKRQVRNNFVISDKPGIVLGQKIIPIEKAGLYVPGGTASYPSSVLMNCIPAKLAKVNEIIMLTPPGKDGKISPQILVAACIAGVERVFKAGGAQAIAAMAYGTQTIPQVDKIVGPGNVYVAEAKKQVYGRVDIDMIAGPSEILIIADSKSNPEFVAADMLSQAEHDANATAILITDCRDFAQKVERSLEIQLSTLPREEIARKSIEKNGRIIISDCIDNMVKIANIIAPEHLELCVDNPFDYLDAIKNAGSIFLGRNCPEALGDYFAGTNHTLPTSGTARFSSPLSVDDFIKKSSFMYYSPEALDNVASKIDYFANKEGLDAHARSVTIRANSRANCVENCVENGSETETLSTSATQNTSRD